MKSESGKNPFELGQEHERAGVPTSRCPYADASRQKVRYICGRQSVKDVNRKAAQMEWAKGVRDASA